MAGRTLAVAIALLAALPGAAFAEHPAGVETHTGSAAFAWWSPASTDGVVTEAFVAAFDDVPGGRSAFAGVFQGWCDESRDELVSRVFFTDGSPAVSVDPLRSAAVAGDVVLHGSEVRIAGCSDEFFEEEDWTETDLGEFQVRLEATWSGRGSPTPDAGAGAWPDPRCAFAGTGAGAYREADAAGSIAGDLPLAGGAQLDALEPADSFAELTTGASAFAFTAFDCGETGRGAGARSTARSRGS